MSYFDILPKELINVVIYKYLDSASIFTLWKAYYDQKDWVMEVEYDLVHVRRFTWTNGVITYGKKFIPRIKPTDMCRYSITFLDYFMNMEMTIPGMMPIYAARVGSIKLLETIYLRLGSLGSGVIFRILDDAFCAANLTIIRWMREKGMLSRVEHQWADNRSIDVLEYIKDNNLWDWGDDRTAMCISHAAMNNSVSLLEWYESNGLIKRYNDLNNFADTAAMFDSLDSLKWLISHGYKLPSRGYELAALNGHLDVIVYLHDIDVPKIGDIWGYLARSTHKNAILIKEYLVGIQCPGWENIT